MRAELSNSGYFDRGRRERSPICDHVAVVVTAQSLMRQRPAMLHAARLTVAGVLASDIITFPITSIALSYLPNTTRF